CGGDPSAAGSDRGIPLGVNEHVDLARGGVPEIARPVDGQRGDAGAGEALAHDHEEVGLNGINAGPTDIGTIDADEVGATRTADDGVVDRGVTNEPGW